jgi:hypothetical protein
MAGLAWSARSKEAMNEQDIAKLLTGIGECAGDYFEAYVIGGSALVLLGIQEMTKDIDLLFTEEDSRAAFIARAGARGFAATDDPADTAAPSPDRSVTLLGADQIIIDCFLRRTTHFTASPGLLRRAAGFLELPSGAIRVVSAGDIFLLKSATGRPSDSRMARRIAEHEVMDWGVLLATLREQRRLGNHRVMYDFAALLSEAGLWDQAPEEFARDISREVRLDVDDMLGAALG